MRWTGVAAHFEFEYQAVNFVEEEDNLRNENNDGGG
jgi:hypothetical protein